MHKRANELRDHLGSKQFDFDNENTVEEKAYYEIKGKYNLEIPTCPNCHKVSCNC